MEVFDHINYHLDHVRTILTSPSYNLPVCLALLAVDAVLSTLILNKVAYTEIDWRAYMQQVAIYRSGERDYNKIRGDTGPLVYGAGHVYIYDFLYKLTGSGKDIWTGQCIFAGTYLLALGLVMACYSRAKVRSPLGFLHFRGRLLTGHPTILHRPLRTCLLCSFRPNGCIRYSSFDCSTTALLSLLFSSLSTRTNLDFTRSGALHFPLVWPLNYRSHLLFQESQ